MIDLSLLLLLLLILGVVLLLSRRRASAGDRVRQSLAQKGVRTGPFPGYAWIHGSRLNVKKLRERLDGAIQDWELVSFETFNGPGRQKGVLRITLAPETPDEDLWPLLKLLAHITRLTTSAHVIAVEAMAPGRVGAVDLPHATVLLASDGGGWNGDVRGVHLIEARLGSPARLRQAVAGTPEHPGFGWVLPPSTPS